MFFIKKSPILILDISYSTIYIITCTTTTKIYIVQSIQPKLKFQQHKKKPPSCMKQDVAKYIPFESFIYFGYCLH